MTEETWFSHPSVFVLLRKVKQMHSGYFIWKWCSIAKNFILTLIKNATLQYFS